MSSPHKLSSSLILSRQFWLSASLLALLGIVGGLLYHSYIQNDGHLIYTLDDPYIHMTLAHNLAQHGTWGINPEVFSSSSSSILYTLLLAAVFVLTSPFILLPLLINVLFAGITLFLAYRICRIEQVSVKATAGLLLALVVLIPLPTLISIGMEHTLQIAINLAFIYRSSVLLSRSGNDNRALVLLGGLALLTVMIRFEGLFLVAIVSFLFLLRRRVNAALLIGGLGLLPLIAFGLWSISEGAYFLPNSLLIKGEKPALSLGGLVAYALVWLRKLYSNPHLLILFISLLLYAAFLMRNTRSRWDRRLTWLYILVPTYIMHLTFARTGWFYRYEAYLMVASLISLAGAIDMTRLPRFRWAPRAIPAAVAIVLALCLWLFPLVKRSVQALVEIPMASRNIYEQQYQMAQFLREHYPEARVVANDIGAISFFSDIRILDMYGLGSIETLTLKMRGQHDAEHIGSLAHQKDSQIAVIYDEWFEGDIPTAWQKVGEWEIKDNVVCAFSTVSFYAVVPDETPELIRRLRAFSDDLPERVRQRGDYLDAE